MVGGGDEQALEVGLHAVGIRTCGHAIMQPATVFVVINVRLHVLFEDFRIGQGPQLAQVPESAPEAIGIEMPVQRFAVFTEGFLSDFPIYQRILAIHITGNAAPEKGMVQAGVEFHPVEAVAPFHADTAQHLVPGLARFAAHLVKIPAPAFCIQIQAGIFNGSIAQARLYFQHFVFLHVEVEVQAIQDAFCSRAVVLERVYKRAHFFGCFAEAGDEIHRHPLSGVAELEVFRIGFDVALYFIAVDQAGGGIGDGAALPLFMADIYNQVRVAAFRESIAVKAHPFGSGQLCFYAVVFEQDGVKARFCLFICFVEAGAVAPVGVVQSPRYGL